MLAEAQVAAATCTLRVLCLLYNVEDEGPLY